MPPRLGFDEGKRYSLNEVPEAIRQMEGGHVRGKLVITVEQNGKS